MKIPTYESQASLQPTQLDPRKAAQFGNEIIKLSEGLSSVADVMQKTKNETQILRQKTELTKRLNDIHNKAMTSPDVWKAGETAEEDMQRVVEETSKGVDSVEARNKYIEQATNEMNRRSVSVNNMILARQLKESKSAVTDHVDSLMEYGLNIVDPNERKQNRDEIIKTVEDAVNDGRIDRTKANDYLKTHLKKMDHDQVFSDLTLDAKGTLRQLELGKDGIYSHLNPADRAQWFTKAKKAVEKEDLENKEIFAIAQNQNEEDILKKHWSGVDVSKDIINAHVSGKISDGFARAVTDAMESPLSVRPKTDAKEYMSLVDEMHKEGADPQKLRTRILNDVSKGKISNSVAEKLYTANYMFEDGSKNNLANMLGQQANSDREKLLRDDEIKKKGLQDRRNIFQKVIDMFNKHNGDDKTKTAEMTQNLMDNVSKGKVKNEDLHSTARKIVSDDLRKKHPDWSSFPKEGKVLIDGMGNKIKMYPDYHYEEM
jgi:hypothetical protein